MFCVGIYCLLCYSQCFIRLTHCQLELPCQVSTFLVQRQPLSWVQLPSFPTFLEPTIWDKKIHFSFLARLYLLCEITRANVPILGQRHGTLPSFPLEYTLQAVWALKQQTTASPVAHSWYPSSMLGNPGLLGSRVQLPCSCTHPCAASHCPSHWLREGSSPVHLAGSCIPDLMCLPQISVPRNKLAP